MQKYHHISQYISIDKYHKTLRQAIWQPIIFMETGQRKINTYQQNICKNYDGVISVSYRKKYQIDVIKIHYNLLTNISDLVIAHSNKNQTETW